MATLTVAQCARTGLVLDLAHAAEAGGDEWVNTGREVIIVTNADSGSHTFSVTVQAEPDGKEVTERVITVAAGAKTMVGPFPTNVYNDEAGVAHITYSAVTAMKVLAVNIPTA